jgi:hypothetical protein
MVWWGIVLIVVGSLFFIGAIVFGILIKILCSCTEMYEDQY